jgi:DNA polymerase alpha subunit B
MGRLARHIITQGNFYPLYPNDEAVPLDVEHCIEFGKLETTPHILILPSDLRHFIKDVDGTIVVNPERLAKGSSGGTYARLKIDLSSTNGTTSIADFCIGEIVKI